jgi:hypothetical protein
MPPAAGKRTRFTEFDGYFSCVDCLTAKKNPAILERKTKPPSNPENQTQPFYPPRPPLATLPRIGNNSTRI